MKKQQTSEDEWVAKTSKEIVDKFMKKVREDLQQSKEQPDTEVKAMSKETKGAEEILLQTLNETDLNFIFHEKRYLYDQMLKAMEAYKDHILEGVTEEEIREAAFQYNGLSGRTILRWPIPANAHPNRGFYDGVKWAINHLKNKE